MLDNLASAIASGFDLLTLTAAIGAVSCSLWMLPANDEALALHRRLWKLFGFCLAGFGISSGAGLLLQTASITEQSVADALPMVGTVLFETHYGQLWLLRIGAVVAAAVLWFWHWRKFNTNRARYYLSFCALLTIIAALSTSGHAGDDGAFSLTNFANILHITGGMLWGGGIIAVSLIVIPAQRDRVAHPPPLIASAILALSRLSAFALAIVIISGIYNSWLQVASWNALWTTTYGQVLLIKMVLVLLMAALGAHHRYASVPAIMRWAELDPPRYLLSIDRFFSSGHKEHAAEKFQRTLRIEAILLIAVLGLAAVLSQQTPAAHMEEEIM